MDSQLEELLVEVLRVSADKLHADLNLSDVDGWDSLRHMELVVALEEGLGLQLSPEEIGLLGSIGSIISVVSSKV